MLLGFHWGELFSPFSLPGYIASIIGVVVIIRWAMNKHKDEERVEANVVRKSQQGGEVALPPPDLAKVENEDEGVKEP